MSKFKVGDKVILANPEEARRWFADPPDFPSVGTISGAGDEDFVLIEEDKANWCWPDSALELVESEEVVEEKKYSIEEIFRAIDAWSVEHAPWDELENIKQELQKADDPEYQEYLRLKSKFE